MSNQAHVGDFELRALSDATPPPFPKEAMFPEVLADAWRPYAATDLTSDGLWVTNFGAFLLRAEGQTIMVDLGIGPGPVEALGGARGNLLKELRDAGCHPPDVQVVVFTHLHFDHVGWSVTTKAGAAVPVFPQARYLVPKIDFDYFRQLPAEASPHAAAVRAQVLPLASCADLELVEDGHVVGPGVTLLATPGHTPGHMSVLFESRGERGIVLGDVVASPAQFHEFEWKLAADTYHDVAQRTRRRVVERLLAERRLVGVGHFPPPHNIGRVVEREGRRRWQPS